jgi:MOSC domain-containing protein YiiM
MVRANPVETCEQCRFDAAQYHQLDVLGTLRALGPMWRQTVEGVDDEVLTTRPRPGVWSVAEYSAHAAAAVEQMGRLLHAIQRVDDLTVDAPDGVPEPDPSAGTGASVDRLHANATRLHDAAVAVGGERAAGWRRTARIGAATVNAAWVVRHAIHDAVHHLRDIGRGIHLLGAGAPTQSGSVAQINASDGGVPKLPIDEAEIGERGVVGDRQAARKHHGRPLQALCLWSTEVIDDLRGEGHPIHPGAAGENLTLSGVDWATIRPGVRLLVGEALAEVSAYAVPCKKNARWFVGRDFNRMSQDRHPGSSRVYAWVLEPGRVRTGDPVTVEP